MMTGAGRNHDHAQAIHKLEERLRLVTNELEHAELELDHALKDLRDHHRYKTALQQIASAESGIWGRLAADALHPPRSPPPAA